MNTNLDKINQLHDKLEKLLKRQDDFSREINDLRFEINGLKTGNEKQKAEEEVFTQKGTETQKDVVKDKEKVATEYMIRRYKAKKELPRKTKPIFNKLPKVKSDIEKFIGEKLISKIGIAITIIGVAIGAKYAIDHELISPLTRIILGYLVGAGLFGFSVKLRKKYENFSAVLLSGSMAIMYFITYFAYSLYDLFPQAVAFLLMVVFTVFTVAAAIKYNKQVIAHIGLVGAYAVPFLLGDWSVKVVILFTYMVIINIGILVIAFRKYWKPLYYASFGLTWLIYVLWYVSKYQISEHFGLALAFITLFFSIFYLTFLAYKLFQKSKFKIDDIILLLVNSFIFFGIGYSVLDNHDTGKQLLGLFTLCNAIIHFMVSAIIYHPKYADRNLFYLVSGLGLVFITIAIPVQLSGNWVTLLWTGEAVLLFWIGRTKNVSAYEMLSYPLMILAFFSIVQDWTFVYDGYNPDMPETRITPIFNINFLTSVLFIAAFGFINKLNGNKKYPSPLVSHNEILKIISLVIPAILLISAYNAFQMEIANYWNQLYADSAIPLNPLNPKHQDYYYNDDLMRFKTIWIINYSLLFVSLLAFVNFRKIKNQQLGYINFGLITLILVIFLIQGFHIISELRDSYLEQTLSQYYHRGIFNIGIRYISIAFAALVLTACYKYIRQSFMQRDLKIAFDFLLHTSVLWIASSELINWMDIAESTQSNKLGLSILWGTYSLFLITVGIWKKKKYLRIGAIVWFGVTLIKLFFYDISYLDTIAKTIVFLSLGVLLLIISFLYHKYKHVIS